LEKVAERTGSPSEQRATLKDGRILGFTECGDAKGEPFLERTLMTSCASCSRPTDCVTLKTQQLNGAQADVT
jgi:hypothetical protein